MSFGWTPRVSPSEHNNSMSPLLTGTSASSTSTLLSTPRAFVTMFLLGGAFGLFFRDEPLEDLFGDPGMVCGEGLDCPVSNEIEPAVSDMGDGEHLFTEQCGDHGGTHPGIVRPAP